MSRARILVVLSAVAAIGFAVAPGVAQAAPDVSGSTDISEDNGFPGVCDQPCYTARKTFEVYLNGNATVPAGANCPVGENTYIYQIEHIGGTGTPIGFIPALTEFEQSVETDDVSSAGFIAGFGINPSATTVSATDIVSWEFGAPPIANGQISTKLFLCSRLTPGTVTDTAISITGQASLDAPGTCVGPVFEPVEEGEPLTCTIGFWKNRADGKKGLLKFFPDGDFDPTLLDAAVALSGGIFADRAALLADLGSKGNRPASQRARQQLAAFLLDLAAGDLFPDNSKCKLFDSNQISSNACGSNLSISDALAAFFTAYNNGDFLAAKDCADDVNNGVGVVGANQGE